MTELGKTLLALGLFLVFFGLVLIVATRIGLPVDRLHLGRLPGDFTYRTKNLSFFFPIGTCLLLSLILSAALYLLSRFTR